MIPSDLVGYLLYLSEMLKIKRIGVKRQGDSTDHDLTIHESTRGGFPQKLQEGLDGRRRGLECSRFGCF
jgi:hypothetical protein